MMTELLQAISDIIGQNVYPSAVPSDCQPPFARYDEKRVSVATFDGLLYETDFNISIVASTKAEALRLADAVIERVNAHLFDGHMVYLQSCDCMFIVDESLTSYDLIFKIL